MKDVFQCLENLRLRGLEFDTILDIGAHHGRWTERCRTIFPQATYHLFEPIPYEALDRLRDDSHGLVQVHHTVLNQVCEEVDWYEERNTGDSMFRERTKYFENTVPVRRPSFRLDDVLLTSWLDESRHIFMKIDTQGAEIPVLKGAVEVLKKTDFVAMELPFFGQYNESVPSFQEHIHFMNTIGFGPFDLVEVHDVQGFTMQVDVVFISKRHPLHVTVQENLFR